MEGPAVHQSPSSIVTFAEDMCAEAGEPVLVALKDMQNKEEFERERRTRENAQLDPGRVVTVLRYHQEDEHGQPVLCMVLPRAERNLLDAIQKEHFAGRNMLRVVAIVQDIALALKEMHSKRLVHADLKVVTP